MLTRLYHSLLRNNLRVLPEVYSEEFTSNQLTNNLLKSIFIGRMAVFFLVPLFILSVIRYLDGTLQTEYYYQLALFTHILVGLTAVPPFLIFIQRAQIKKGTFDRQKSKILLNITVVGICCSSMLIMIVTQINGSVFPIFCAFLTLVNFILILPLRRLMRINIAMFFFLIFVGYYFMELRDLTLYVFILKSIGVTIPTIGGSIFQYNQRVKSFIYEKELEKKNKIIEEALTEKFEREMAEIEMKALRAQMNPHFLFNALNSIKLYVVSNDPQTAAKYLTKFSRLIRRILHNSKFKSISLENEIEALDLYIQMEQFRFDFKFDYEINIDKKIDADFVEIPPMLIQPYVENAIWHGLMYKEKEKGMLKVHVKIKDNRLVFVIDDNGVGRQKSIRLKSTAKTKHESVGMQITANRLEMANRLYDTHGNVKIIDKKDEQGANAGTKVIFSLPLN